MLELIGVSNEAILTIKEAKDPKNMFACDKSVQRFIGIEDVEFEVKVCIRMNVLIGDCVMSAVLRDAVPFQPITPSGQPEPLLRVRAPFFLGLRRLSPPQQLRTIQNLLKVIGVANKTIESLTTTNTRNTYTAASCETVELYLQMMEIDFTLSPDDILDYYIIKTRVKIHVKLGSQTMASDMSHHKISLHYNTSQCVYYGNTPLIV
eukprot:scaffold59410_cov66-Attheya_sp.AAC.4